VEGDSVAVVAGQRVDGFFGAGRAAGHVGPVLVRCGDDEVEHQQRGLLVGEVTAPPTGLAGAANATYTGRLATRPSRILTKIASLSSTRVDALVSPVVANPDRGGRMPKYAWHKTPSEVKRRYFELIRTGSIAPYVGQQRRRSCR
jgi:hypothetical protein